MSLLNSLQQAEAVDGEFLSCARARTHTETQKFLFKCINYVSAFQTGTLQPRNSENGMSVSISSIMHFILYKPLDENLANFLNWFTSLVLCGWPYDFKSIEEK